MRRITNGMWLVVIGLVHEAVGLLTAAGIIPIPGAGRRNLLVEIARGGVIGSIEPDPVRSIFFWYLFFGAAVLILGGLMHQLERAGHMLPASLGWCLAAMALAGAALIPASGFWLLLPLAWRIVRAPHRTAEVHPC
jgi:uncharacterized protein DUF6463